MHFNFDVKLKKHYEVHLYGHLEHGTTRTTALSTFYCVSACRCTAPSLVGGDVIDCSCLYSVGCSLRVLRMFLDCSLPILCVWICSSVSISPCSKGGAAASCLLAVLRLISVSLTQHRGASHIATVIAVHDILITLSLILVLLCKRPQLCTRQPGNSHPPTQPAL